MSLPYFIPGGVPRPLRVEVNVLPSAPDLHSPKVMQRNAKRGKEEGEGWGEEKEWREGRRDGGFCGKKEEYMGGRRRVVGYGGRGGILRGLVRKGWRYVFKGERG